MDRLISEEERIRRAEDLLERRKNSELRISSENFGRDKSNEKIKKMLIQILVSLVIYCGIYYIRNSKNDYIKNWMNNINTVLGYDINFKELWGYCYNNFSEKYNEIINKKEKYNEVETQNNIENVNIQTENIENQNEVSIQNENLGIGGSADTGEILPVNEDEEMKVDAEYIKQNFNISKPLKEYVITSKFGIRDSNEIVSANHKGIDLGATTGSSIYSAMDGTVKEVSNQGDFGKHILIENKDIIAIYAHCNELLVKEGDSIIIGQEIAKVGATGKATGPHLHFEIRRNNESINPEYILQF